MYANILVCLLKDALNLRNMDITRSDDTVGNTQACLNRHCQQCH